MILIVILILAILVIGNIYDLQKSLNKEPQTIDTVDDALEEVAEGRAGFNIHCAACHRIGGNVSPNLLLRLEYRMDKTYFNAFVRAQDSLLEVEDNYIMNNGSYFDFENIAISHRFKLLSLEDTDQLYEYILSTNNQE